MEKISEDGLPEMGLKPYPAGTPVEKFDVRAVCAVDSMGRIGVNNALAYESPGDMSFFRKTTSPGVLIFGFNAHNEFVEALQKGNVEIRKAKSEIYGSAPLYLPKSGRMIFCDNPTVSVHEFLEAIRSIGLALVDLPIWICGGAATYERYSYVTKITIVSHVDRFSDAVPNPALEYGRVTYMPALWRYPANAKKDTL